ncbi:TPA: DeoR family transcriptional regulator [Streptococcus pneumoniae]
MKINRKKEILNLLENSDVISYQELAQSLHVSTMTIRRDVSELEKENLVIKEHGGVRKVTFNTKNN